MDKQTLSKAEFALLQQMTQEKVAGWTNEISILNQRVQEARSLLEKMKNLTDISQQGGYSSNDSVLQNIIAIFKETDNELLGSSYIRNQFHNRTGKELRPKELLAYLKNSNGVSFIMEGDRRFAKWRMVVDHA